ncbi:MAG: dihydroxyacetone kinase subunit L [Chloroflexi bacterium RBG_16_57_11]|nr:MAG: dihydroxyacetone kinase subunit L [Chloroflexi bacterium RBG_16_57_11]
MLSQVGAEEIKRMLGGALAIIRVKSDELCLLDAAIGDGDHGITMLRAMEKMGKVIEAHPHAALSDLLSEIAWALMDIDGGATGPLYGSLFLGLSEGVTGLDTLDGDAFARMFEQGVVSIEQQTKARLGDKTLMDALIPAVDALRSSADQGKTIPELLEAASLAAMQGAEATRNFSARYGRAKYQGERTLGHPDPGSISMAYLFQGLQDGLNAGG